MESSATLPNLRQRIIKPTIDASNIIPEEPEDSGKVKPPLAMPIPNHFVALLLTLAACFTRFYNIGIAKFVVW
jgi:hypothetical protein